MARRGDLIIVIVFLVTQGVKEYPDLGVIRKGGHQEYIYT